MITSTTHQQCEISVLRDFADAFLAITAAAAVIAIGLAIPLLLGRAGEAAGLITTIIVSELVVVVVALWRYAHCERQIRALKAL